jgi:hypothetical protein
MNKVSIALFGLAVIASPAMAQSGPAAGSYECWAFSSARMDLNFKVTAPGQYVGADNSKGKFTFNPGTKQIDFVSGSLHGAMPDGFKSIYEVRKGKPTVSFVSPRGSEASFCEKV